jgi:hypothetical protein
VQPADIAVTLRRRTPWEAMDLGLAMLQRWWRLCYAPHLIVGASVVAAAWALGWWLERPWLALLVVWWMKPLYDRLVLHVLSRAVFGELQSTREVLTRRSGEWLGAGLLPYLLVRWWPDMSRSFNLPVRQLEGQTGAAGRERRSVLGRRASSYAVWLTVACINFELVLYWSLQRLAQVFLPAKALEGRALADIFATGGLFTHGDLLAYAAAVMLVEPFYVAAGFALYLNRRTLLEGWDVEVALRRIAESRVKAPAAAAAALLACLALFFLPVPPAGAADPDGASGAEKNPRREIAEVLKAPEFPHQVDVTRWQRRDPGEAPEETGKPRRETRSSGGINLGQGLAQVAQVIFWAAAIGALAYALWWAARMLPLERGAAPEPYRPPASLFGMALAPDTLPADVAAAALDLARKGRLREALSLLYRGALSDLVHRRGVELLASHTEAEVLALAQKALPTQGWYMENLVKAWRLSAYARRDPAAAEVERLAVDYRGFSA